MGKKLLFPMIVIALVLWIGLPTSGKADESRLPMIQPGNMTPDNTVILANWGDARFSQDFSALLKHLRLEWIVLDSAVVPDSVYDKNLILLGRPNAVYTGEIIQGMLTVEERERLRAATDHPIIIEKASPWMDGRTIIICAGADLLLTRNAAEEALRAIIAAAPPASDWIQTTYESELDEGVRDYVDQLRYGWDDEELPLADLTMDVGATPRWRISAQEAAEDVERLFYLFSHGYAGYAFFNEHGEFELAKERILQELPSKSSWTDDAFSSLLYEHLSFIVDCHVRIGDYQFAEHTDFWYDTQQELTLGSNGYLFAADGTMYTVLSINGGDPAPFVFPSLNQQGNAIYRLGLLSSAEPAPLRLTAKNETEEYQFEVELQRSDFSYYSEDVFREDVIGGIPVVRARSFADYYADELSEFVETGSSYRGQPVVVVDVRGNGGGNEHWPVSWIQRLTGRRAESVFIFSELKSKTTMMGRVNAFNYWDLPMYGTDAEQHTSIAESFESGARQPYWVGPYYPQIPLIANDTTIIVIMNDKVASAGEGFVMRISQAENVIVVGENSMGCLTFGNISLHQLPHSRLMVWLPINFGFYLDMEFREGIGLAPDLWVPAADAVNYTVAAVRNGTITTRQPLTFAILQQEFVPENPQARVQQEKIRFWSVVLFFAAGGVVWAYFVRQKPRMVAVVGAVWIVVGSIWITREVENPAGVGFLLIGIICFAWGGYSFRRGIFNASDG